MNLDTSRVESILPRDSSTPGPITFWKIAGAVLVGNLLTGLVGGIVWFAITH